MDTFGHIRKPAADVAEASLAELQNSYRVPLDAEEQDAYRAAFMDSFTKVLRNDD